MRRHVLLAAVVVLCPLGFLLAPRDAARAVGEGLPYHLAVVARAHGRPGIYVSEPGGDRFRRLTDGEFDVLPAWSPDGRRLAFLSFRKADADLGARFELAFHFGLYAIDADGQLPRRLMDAPLSQFAWSPDGRRILFQSSHEDPRNRAKDGLVSAALYVVEADGKALKRLTPPTESNQLGTWSPDGRRIAFTSIRDGKRSVHVMQADGTGSRRLTPAADDAHDPLWSPDGRRIVFASGRGELRTNVVHVVNADGSGGKPLTDGPPSETPLAWSPDGRRVLFTAGDVLEVMDADGGGRTRLTDGGSRVVEAAFAPDGKRVFYRTVRDRALELFSVAADGQGRRKEAAALGDVSGFALSPLVKGREGRPPAGD
jgi:TolB protein